MSAVLFTCGKSSGHGCPLVRLMGSFDLQLWTRIGAMNLNVLRQRLECGELAPAVRAFQSGSKLHALQTLRAIP